MIQKLNKNVSVWRGDKTPPTNYHIWIKPDGNIYIYNGTYWEINNTDLITDVYNELNIAIQNEIARATKTESSLQTALNNEINRSLEEDKKLLENDKQYTVVSITEGLEENVREAFQLRETTENINIGPVIKIYKDSSLKQVTLENQILKFVYVLANGKESEVDINISKFLTDQEFGEGLSVNTDGIVSVKKDFKSEKFLSVSNDGIKISGIQDALSNTKDESIQEATILIDNSWSWYEG